MYRVSQFIWRGPRPTFRELIDNNIHVILCLESGIYDALHSDDYEGVDWYAYGISRIDYPLSDIFPPSQDQLEAIARLMEKYSKGTAGKMLVHCLSGKDRTGIAIAYYRVTREKWDIENAILEWKAYGRHWFYTWWEIFFRSYLKGER